MKSGARIVTIAGIPIILHWTFAFLIFWIGYVAYREGFSLWEAFYFFLIVLGLFVCVIAHEYGHALVARHYGIPTRDIFILPIGGLARLEYLPSDPTKEMAIAIAGPLVNLVLALLMGLSLWYLDGTTFLEALNSFQILFSPKGVLYALMLLNVVLFFFNLIPAYPMDGGRILRAALSIKWGSKKATIMVSYLAQVIGIFFFAFALFKDQFTLTLIGIFIFFTSGWERRALNQREASTLETTAAVMDDDTNHPKPNSL